MTEAFPLQWPQGWPRTPDNQRQPSRFAPHGLTDEARYVEWELERLGATHFVVSTNVELRRDGLPYSSRRQPEDPGVAVYFLLDGRQQCIPCDRWRKVEENTRAIWKSIEALRGLERWGAKSFVDAAFRGFEALPPPGSVVNGGPPANRAWWEVLEVAPDASQEIADAAYRTKARKAHPDAGGSAEAMAELNQAIKEARER